MLTVFQFAVLTTEEIIDSDLFVVADFFIKVSLANEMYRATFSN